MLYYTIEMNINILTLKTEARNQLKKIKGQIAPTTYAKFERKITNSNRSDVLNKLYSELRESQQFITSQKERITKEKQKVLLKAKAKLLVQKPVLTPKQTSINQLIIDKKMINRKIPYTYLTHEIQLKRMMKQQPNKLYRQTVNYYNGKGELINDTDVSYILLEYDFDEDERILRSKSTSKYHVDKSFQWIGRKSDLTKEEIIRINFNMSTDGSDGTWKIRKFIEIMTDEDGINDQKAYAIINTYAYDQTNYKKMEKYFNYNKQILQDNDTTGTCLYDGVLKFFESSNDKNKKKYYNKLIREKDTYCKAYKIDEIEELAKLCNSSIKITNLITGDNHIYNQNQFNSYCIELINTRYNHAELYTALNCEAIELSSDDYKEKKNKSKYYVEKYGKLYTLDNIYKVQDSKFKKLFDQWKIDNNFNMLSIGLNSPTYKLLQSYDYDIHRFFNKFEINNELYQEYDLKGAYYNYSDKSFNRFYRGIPSGSFINVYDPTFTIKDFKTHTDNNLVGFYEVEIIKFKDEKMTSTFEKLGFIVGQKYVLFTSMIEMLNLHIKFKFYNISYAPSVHIPFTSEFLEKENGTRHYSKAFGIMISSKNIIKTEIKTDVKDIRTYSIIDKPNCNYFEEKNIINVIEYDDSKPVYHHIGYSYHAYTSTLVLEEILKHDINNIFGVKLDSIIFKKDVKLIETDQFKIKEAKIEKLLFNINDDDILNNLDDYQPVINNDLICNTVIKRFILDEGIDEDDCNIVIQNNIINTEDDKIYIDETNGYYKKFIKSICFKNKFNPIFTQNNVKITNRIVKIGGQAGSGKTRSIMSALENKHICYSTTCWKLIQGMKEDYPDIIGLSINKLEGKTCNIVKKENDNEEDEEQEQEQQEHEIITKSKKETNKNIRYIVLDEITLLRSGSIQNVINDPKYAHCFIFILGDIDIDGFYYQCANRNEVFKSCENIQFIEYTKSYRFDQELNNNLIELRKKMKIFKNHYKDNDSKSLDYLKKYFYDSPFKQCLTKIDDITYNENDIGISCNNENGKYSRQLTDKFVKKGTKPKYFIKTTNLFKNQIRGREITEEEITKHKNYEMKLFHTIHSYQGLQLNHDNKIIIDLSNIFDYNLLYTAMSRARRMDQIKIIN